MKTKNNYRPNSEWQAIPNDIVNQTSNILEKAKTYLHDVENGNTEYLTNMYYEIERHLSKTIVEIETKYIDRLTFDRLEFLFGKLVKVEQQLKKHLNMESYEEFKDFYGSIDYDYDSEKLKKAIEPNPLRESYLKILNGYLIANNNDSEIEIKPSRSKKKNNENETWFKVGLEFANGNIEKIANIQIQKYGRVNISAIVKDLFPHSIYPKYVRGMINQSYNGKKVEQLNIFKRSNSVEEMTEIVVYCQKNNIPILNSKFMEIHRRYINANFS